MARGAPEIHSVRNAVNLGCGGAWTQGALLAESDWVVLLNNDVVVSGDAMTRCSTPPSATASTSSARRSPRARSTTTSRRTPRRSSAPWPGRSGRGWFHGVCFAVRKRVFESIGFLDTDRRLGGREDVEYLVRCQRNGVPVGTVGDALLHHFGSITQKAIKLETGQKDLGDRDYFYASVGMGWLARKHFKAARKQAARSWLAQESGIAGYVMHMLRKGGRWVPADYL